jgi:predicted aconitase with swiveling domain
MHIRRFAPILVALAMLLIVASCTSVASQQKLAQIGPQDPLGSAHWTGAHWTGTLTPPNGMSGALDVHGSVSFVRNGPGSSVATVVISNAIPRGFHPWEIYRGQCGNDASLIGALSAYPWLAVNDDGKATANATLGAELGVGDYHINVNASPIDQATIIACGNVPAVNGV